MSGETRKNRRPEVTELWNGLRRTVQFPVSVSRPQFESPLALFTAGTRMFTLMKRPLASGICCLCTVGALLLAPGRSMAQQQDVVPELEQHPLYTCLQYVEKQRDYIRHTINDYQCVLVKRERIDGKLQNMQYMRASVRRERRKGGQVVQPFSVYMEYLAPKRLAGRRMLYVEGENDGKILVRKGGASFQFVTLKVSLDSPAAQRESLLPITDVGFEKMAESFYQKIQHDMGVDKSGENTRVEYFKQARINGRSTTRIKVTHPRPQDGLNFHLANVYIDDEYQVPVRVDTHDWPQAGESQPTLINEFTYVDLKINVELPDDFFTESRFGSTEQ
jgi:hypothetical protein